MRSRQAQALLELLIVLTVIALLGTAIAAAVVVAQRSEGSARLRTAGAEIAAETLEAARYIAYSDDSLSQGWNRLYCPPSGFCSDQTAGFPAVYKNALLYTPRLIAKEIPKEIVTGSTHTCAIRPSGSVQCWGANTYGQLGNNDALREPQSVPVDVVGINNAISISSGFSHACALLEDGTAKCWGQNLYGQIGDSTAGSDRLAPVDVCADSGCTAKLTGIIAISAGLRHSCALLQNGTAKCWGNDGAGQLGNSSVFNDGSFFPVSVVGLNTIISIETGGLNTCATLTDGTVRCWGAGIQGRNGNGSLSNQALPVSVLDVTTAVKITMGTGHSCVLLNDGTVRCWGLNTSLQLGNTVPSNSAVPVSVADLSGVISLEAGGTHTCASRYDKTLRCWGSAANGRLGNGATSPNQYLPQSVLNLSAVTAFAAGGNHSCALLINGPAKCWGGGSFGQLGNNDAQINNTTPVSVVGFDPVSVTLREWHLRHGVDLVGIGGRIFSRALAIENVCRSGGAGTGDIVGTAPCAAGSYDDPWTQKVTVTVKTNGTSDIETSSIFTRSHNVASTQSKWSSVDSSAVTAFGDSYFQDSGNLLLNPIVLQSGQISGWLTSQVFDTQAINGVGLNSILWQGTLPSGKIRLQVASSNCPNGASNPPLCDLGEWEDGAGPGADFWGPNGVSGYFEAPPGIPMPICPVGIALTSSNCPHWNKRYFRYRVELCSNDCVTAGVSSPVINEISINWSR